MNNLLRINLMSKTYLFLLCSGEYYGLNSTIPIIGTKKQVARYIRDNIEKHYDIFKSMRFCDNYDCVDGVSEQIVKMFSTIGSDDNINKIKIIKKIRSILMDCDDSKLLKTFSCYNKHSESQFVELKKLSMFDIVDFSKNESKKDKCIKDSDYDSDDISKNIRNIKCVSNPKILKDFSVKSKKYNIKESKICGKVPKNMNISIKNKCNTGSKTNRFLGRTVNKSLSRKPLYSSINSSKKSRYSNKYDKKIITKRPIKMDTQKKFMNMSKNTKHSKTSIYKSGKHSKSKHYKHD